MYMLSCSVFLLSFNPSCEGWIDNDLRPGGRWREKEDRCKGDAETLADCCTLINYLTELFVLPTHWSHPLNYFNMRAHIASHIFSFCCLSPLKKTLCRKCSGSEDIQIEKNIELVVNCAPTLSSN